MTGQLTVECNVYFSRGGRGAAKRVKREAAPAPAQSGRVPRISRLMALAIRFDGLVRSGQVKDYAELARLGHVTRARMTQIMNLLLLAPDIQEAILFLPRVEEGRSSIHLRHLQPVAHVPDWRKQRKLWAELVAECNA